MDTPAPFSPAAQQVEVWPIEKLIPYARNPRKNDGVVEQMMASIREFGFKLPILARSTGDVVDGHLRLKAAIKLGMTSLPVLLCDEWSEAQVKAFRLLVNRSVAWAEWDNELLALEMADLKALDYDTALTGFTTDELTALDNGAAGGFGEGDGDEKAASLLGLLDITIEDPKTPVEAGDVWALGKHKLLCSGVLEEWTIWTPYLTAGCIFCPFPGPFVLLSERAKETPLLLVQPDTYIAGHIIDRYIEFHGSAEGVVKERGSAQ